MLAVQFGQKRSNPGLCYSKLPEKRKRKRNWFGNMDAKEYTPTVSIHLRAAISRVIATIGEECDSSRESMAILRPAE